MLPLGCFVLLHDHFHDHEYHKGDYYEVYKYPQEIAVFYRIRDRSVSALREDDLPALPITAWRDQGNYWHDEIVHEGRYKAGGSSAHDECNGKANYLVFLQEFHKFLH